VVALLGQPRAFFKAPTPSQQGSKTSRINHELSQHCEVQRERVFQNDHTDFMLVKLISHILSENLGFTVF